MKKNLALTACVMVVGTLLVSCNKDLDIRQAYSFSLETMPVQKRIAVGETAEIRSTLVREGQYSDARYRIRYFQPDGKGELRMEGAEAFIPNDLYALDKTAFRLYYTSGSDDQQLIDVYVEDNMGQVIKKSFSFQNENNPGQIESPQ